MGALVDLSHWLKFRTHFTAFDGETFHFSFTLPQRQARKWEREQRGLERAGRANAAKKANKKLLYTRQRNTMAKLKSSRWAEANGIDKCIVQPVGAYIKRVVSLSLSPSLPCFSLVILHCVTVLPLAHKTHSTETDRYMGRLQELGTLPRNGVWRMLHISLWTPAVS